MMRSLFSLLCLLLSSASPAQEEIPSLSFRNIPLREDMGLFVNGCTSDGVSKAAFTTRNGDVWLLNNAMSETQDFRELQWQRFASGLSEPSLIRYREDGKLLVRQSVETTLIADRNNDGIADEYMAVDPVEIPNVNSPSPFKGIVWLDRPETSGPFNGQFFGGSSSANYISRLSRDIHGKGTHFGLFVFQKGLVYPVDSMTRLDARSWLIAQSNRADSDRTRDKSALQRAVWNDSIPFEVKSVVATDNGLHLIFTKSLLIESAESEYSYRIESMAERKEVKISSIEPGKDEKSVSIECAPLLAGIMYHVSFEGVWSAGREPVRNPACLFTWRAND